MAANTTVAQMMTDVLISLSIRPALELVSPHLESGPVVVLCPTPSVGLYLVIFQYIETSIEDDYMQLMGFMVSFLSLIRIELN